MATMPNGMTTGSGDVQERDDDAVYADIAHGHCWEARTTGDDEISIRIHRPSGTGRPLYETMTLSHTEAEALLQLMMDTVG